MSNPKNSLRGVFSFPLIFLMALLGAAMGLPAQSGSWVVQGNEKAVIVNQPVSPVNVTIENQGENMVRVYRFKWVVDDEHPNGYWKLMGGFPQELLPGNETLVGCGVGEKVEVHSITPNGSFGKWWT